MSADNFGVIHPHEGGWGLSMVFASDERVPDLSRPYFTAESVWEVIDHANEEYFEYGYRIMPENEDTGAPSLPVQLERELTGHGFDVADRGHIALALARAFEAAGANALILGNDFEMYEVEGATYPNVQLYSVTPIEVER